MEQWLQWARDPVFHASLAILVVGFGRLLLLNMVSLVTLLGRSRRNGRSLPWAELFRRTLRYAVPLSTATEARGAFSVVSVVFHVAIILTPLLLGSHVLLWQRGLGFGWPTIANWLADLLTLFAVVGGLTLFVMRLASPDARGISRTQDYLLPLLVVLPFLSGFLVMHPSVSPFEHHSAMFVHVMSGNLVLALLPFSKLGHAALFPVARLVSELAWHLEPGAGEAVARSLGKEGESI